MNKTDMVKRMGEILEEALGRIQDLAAGAGLPAGELQLVLRHHGQDMAMACEEDVRPPSSWEQFESVEEIARQADALHADAEYSQRRHTTGELYVAAMMQACHRIDGMPMVLVVTSAAGPISIVAREVPLPLTERQWTALYPGNPGTRHIQMQVGIDRKQSS